MNLKFLVTAIATTAIFGAAISAGAQEFPLTLEHRFGTTLIEEKPTRVVSLSFAGHDNLLALGVKPVALRYWYGDDPFGVWPWAQEALGDHQPVVLEGELNIEQIAALAPDVIVGLASGITAEQYQLLSQIAPTVAAEAQYTDYSTPWPVLARTLGRVVGEDARAAQLVATIQDRIDATANSHPEWQGKSAVVAFFWEDAPGAYRSTDVRPQFLSELGFVTPQAIDDAGDSEAFYVTFSAEDPSALDTDLLLWVVSGDDLQGVKDMPLRKTLNAHLEGREVLADKLLAGAFSHGSLLSLPYVLDELIPLIEAAVDGDPATIVSSSQTGGLLD